MLPLKMLQTEDISDQNITFSATNEPLSYQTIRELVSNHTLFIIGTGLNQYWLPILVLAGLFGNTLSLMVMLLSHNRTFTTCLYLAALAVSDNILLILGGHTWIATVFKGENLFNKWVSIHPSPKCDYDITVYIIFEKFSSLNSDTPWFSLLTSLASLALRFLNLIKSAPLKTKGNHCSKAVIPFK